MPQVGPVTVGLIIGRDGLTGQPGRDGQDGEDGITIPGVPGPMGPPGSAGTSGVSGPRGLAGDDGDEGLIGPPGPAGPAGAIGPTGSTGLTGPIGYGLDGDDGEPGLAIPGPTGATGAIGPTGPAGSGGGTTIIQPQEDGEDQLRWPPGSNFPTGWATYTPAWTSSGVQPVLNNGTLVGRYRWLSTNQIEVEIYLAIGSTTTAGTGEYLITIPVAAVASPGSSVFYGAVMPAYFLDSGIRYWAGIAHIRNSVTQISISGSWAVAGSWGATNPFTVSNGDEMAVHGVYDTSI